MIKQVQREQPQMHALIVHCTQEDPKDRPTMADVLVALPKIYQKENIDGSAYGQRLSLTDSRHQEPSTRGVQLTLSIPAPQQPVIAQRPSQYLQGHNRQSTPTGGSDQPAYTPAPQRPAIGYTGNAPVPTHFNLGVGSTVQLVAVEPNAPPRYGVIKWTGNVEGIEGMIAGIELEEYIDGCNDGTFPQREEKHFDCPSGHGLYFPLAKLRPDERFAGGAHISARRASYDNPIQAPMEEEVDQYIENASEQLHKYVGEGRGIQGHQNSCYLDSTVFGLFALSDVFDNMFLAAKHTNDENRIAISELLWKGIVNPLRKNGVVRFESVMMLRNKLEELGKMEGITEKKKDPEEFLNMLFKHMLRVTPFISIRRPFGVEEEFFVQLFVEFDSSLKVPTIEKLLNRMFIEQNISFTKCPCRLLIQVPRFGREFKTYQKIVPDLKLDIKELTDAAGPKCVRCGKRSSVKCYDCKDSFRNDGNGVHFCTSCSKIVHGKETRARHQLQDIDNVLSDLDLLSVICIETSHYVCFTRDYDKSKWIFFDSMAKRLYDTYNIPKVTDCTDLLNDWVYPHTGDHTRLMDTPPRQLPELVRRFTQDVYMCVYIQPEVAMYGES